MYALVHRAHRLADRPGIALSELAQEPFVFFDPQVGTALYGEILALLGRYQIQPDIAQEVGEAMTIIGLVSTGLGVSILPASFRRVRLSDVVWIPLTEQDAQSEVWLVWSRQREMPAVVASMMKLLLPFPQQK